MQWNRGWQYVLSGWKLLLELCEHIGIFDVCQPVGSDPLHCSAHLAGLDQSEHLPSQPCKSLSIVLYFSSPLSPLLLQLLHVALPSFYKSSPVIVSDAIEPVCHLRPPNFSTSAGFSQEGLGQESKPKQGSVSFMLTQVGTYPTLESIPMSACPSALVLLWALLEKRKLAEK